MILRIWRTEVDPARMEEYEEFEREISTPMFQQQPGVLGVLFLRSENDCVALSLWKDMDAVEALATSPTYLETVDRLLSTGLLRDKQTLEVLRVEGGLIDFENLPDHLSQ